MLVGGFVAGERLSRAAMPDKEISREELKALKRQAAIRAREEDIARKRKEDEERKKRELEQMKREFEEQERLQVEERLRFLEKQAAARAQRKARTEKLNQKREEKINARREAWLAKANESIFQICAEQDAEDERLELALEEARERKRAKEQRIRDIKGEAKARNEELEALRIEANNRRAQERELRGLDTVDRLKTEATDELESFILNPYPVPLKQVLAGRMRPVPTVTELLAALKDQKEELKELEEQDIATRAMLRNQTLFQYVRDIQLKAEATRIKPPMPQQADLGRSRNRASSPRRQSPTNKMRTTGMRSTR